MTDRQALERLLLAVWETHDQMEELLTAVERHGRARLTSADPRTALAIGELWDAHDLIERATIKLHGCFSAAELTRLQKG
jgi:hypothetical protein